jgi:hypothetical protein
MNPQSPPRSPFLSNETVVQFRLSRGMCPGCGTRIYSRQGDDLEPLTIEGIVLVGRCLFCYPPAAAATNVATAVIKTEPVDHPEYTEDNGGRIKRKRPVEDTTPPPARYPAPPERDPVFAEQDFARKQEERNAVDTLFAARVEVENQEEEAAAAADYPVEEEKEEEEDRKMMAVPRPTTTKVTITDIHGCVYRGKLLRGTLRRGTVEVSYTKPLHAEEHPGAVSCYKGEVVDGRFHGKGYQKDCAGCIYEGAFEYGASNGYGVCTWPTGWVYQGEWMNDLRHGQGRCFQRIRRRRHNEDDEDESDSDDDDDDTSIGEEYSGEWQEDMWNGTGTLRFAGGDVYHGQFFRDKMHGQGRYSFSDGSVYEGEFRKDVRSGQGNMVYADGQVYDGQWRKNWRDGHGTLSFTDGSVFEGTFKSDEQREGLLRMSDGIMRRIRNGQVLP